MKQLAGKTQKKRKAHKEYDREERNKVLIRPNGRERRDEKTRAQKAKAQQDITELQKRKKWI